MRILDLKEFAYWAMFIMQQQVPAQSFARMHVLNPVDAQCTFPEAPRMTLMSAANQLHLHVQLMREAGHQMLVLTKGTAICAEDSQVPLEPSSQN